jgi:outer membrane protein OmpA-like peptidoglycan-associated protein
MKKYLTFCMLLFTSLCADAAFKVRKTIEFNENSTEMTSEGEATMKIFEHYANDYTVEKIDIAVQCHLNQVTFHELQLGRERSQMVYQCLIKIFPNSQDFEIRSFDKPEIILTGEELPNCILITAYFLEENAPPLNYPEVVLFPEEFDGYRDVPSSFESANGSKTDFIVNNIYFEGNSAACLDESFPTLEALLLFMNANPQLRIELEGHVNGHMGRRYLKLAAKTNPERKAYKNGKELSLARAETVRDYLVSYGINADRIVCIGKGGTEKRFKRPKNSRENEANRRIEINILK